MPSSQDIFSSLTGILPAGLQDVEAVRILLRGDSVIDWHRLAIRDGRHADAFLALQGFTVSDAADATRLLWLRDEALAYLDTHLKLWVGPEVRAQRDVRELLVTASHDGQTQREACALLKVMHVIHHAAGRELLYRLPVPMNELVRRIEGRIFGAVDDMKRAGVAIAGFAASRKTPESVFTKLLARRDSLAAEVHDRLRFRIVTRTLDDLFQALLCLTRWVIPFNYVLPGESRNDLIDLEGTLSADPRLRDLRGLLQSVAGVDDAASRVNWFSAAGFRTINFVADIPVPVGDLVVGVPGHDPRQHGRVVFLLAEFQLLDEVTAAANETGDNRHELYKARQIARVIDRLNGAARRD
ncbi:MAG: TIGR04552 family protein [bacterium]